MSYTGDGDWTGANKELLVTYYFSSLPGSYTLQQYLFLAPNDKLSLDKPWLDPSVAVCDTRLI